MLWWWEQRLASPSSCQVTLTAARKKNTEHHLPLGNEGEQTFPPHPEEEPCILDVKPLDLLFKVTPPGDGAVQGLLNLSLPQTFGYFPPFPRSVRKTGAHHPCQEVNHVSKGIPKTHTQHHSPHLWEQTCIAPAKEALENLSLPSPLSQTLSTSSHPCSSYHALTHSLLQSREEMWPI